MATPPVNIITSENKIFTVKFLDLSDQHLTEAFLGSILKDLSTAKKIYFQLEESAPFIRSLNFLAFLREILKFGEQHNIECDKSGLPTVIQKLLESLKTAQPAKKLNAKTNYLQKITQIYTESVKNFLDIFKLIFDCIGRSFYIGRRNSHLRSTEFLYFLQNTGAEGLIIVSLLNFLVGLIIAFVGALQLEKVGANIFVADLVAISTVREMGVMVTAIVLAGRSGAAFAAAIGTMKVNEEIDALNAFKINTVDFLVLPRVWALILMTPLLTIFADFTGILGGSVVATLRLNISFTEYLYEVQQAITPTHFYIGIVKSFVFGAIIAITGCWRGFRCGTDAASVGKETTKAVVYAIAALVVADALFTVLCDVLKI